MNFKLVIFVVINLIIFNIVFCKPMENANDLQLSTNVIDPAEEVEIEPELTESKRVQRQTFQAFPNDYDAVMGRSHIGYHPLIMGYPFSSGNPCCCQAQAPIYHGCNSCHRKQFVIDKHLMYSKSAQPELYSRSAQTDFIDPLLTEPYIYPQMTNRDAQMYYPQQPFGFPVMQAQPFTYPGMPFNPNNIDNQIKYHEELLKELKRQKATSQPSLPQ